MRVSAYKVESHSSSFMMAESYWRECLRNTQKSGFDEVSEKEEWLDDCLNNQFRPTVEPSPESDIQKLLQLIESNQIAEARSLACQLSIEWPENDRVQHLAKVLAPPAVRTVERKIQRSLKEDRAWIRDNAHNYPGMWLSVYGGELVYEHVDLQKVVSHTKHILGNEKALLHFQPED